MHGVLPGGAKQSHHHRLRAFGTPLDNLIASEVALSVRFWILEKRMDAYCWWYIVQYAGGRHPALCSGSSRARTLVRNASRQPRRVRVRFVRHADRSSLEVNSSSLVPPLTARLRTISSPPCRSTTSARARSAPRSTTSSRPSRPCTPFYLFRLELGTGLTLRRPPAHPRKTSCRSTKTGARRTISGALRLHSLLSALPLTQVVDLVTSESAMPPHRSRRRACPARSLAALRDGCTPSRPRSTCA